MALNLFARNLRPAFGAPDSDGICPRLVQRVPAWGRTARRHVCAWLTRFAIHANAPRVASLGQLTPRRTTAEERAWHRPERRRPSKFLILIKLVSCHSQNSRTARLAFLFGWYSFSCSIRIRLLAPLLLAFLLPFMLAFLLAVVSADLSPSPQRHIGGVLTGYAVA